MGTTALLSLSLLCSLLILTRDSEALTITKTRKTLDLAGEKALYALANSDANIINNKKNTKTWGINAQKSHIDRNLNTTGALFSRDVDNHENTQIDLGGIYKVQKIIFFLAYGQDKYLFKDFTVFTSLDCVFCGQRENLLNSATISRPTYFTETRQTIELDFGVDGLMTGFISYSALNQWKNSVEPGHAFAISEIIVLGDYQRPIFRPKNATLARDPTPDMKFVLPLKTGWALKERAKSEIWPESLPFMAATSITKSLVFYGDYQGCAFGCYDKCNTVYGLLNHNTTLSARYVVTTAVEAFNVKAELNWTTIETNQPFLYEALKFVGNGRQLSLIKDNLPPNPDPESIVVIFEISGFLEKPGMAQKLIDFMSKGQNVFLSRSTHKGAPLTGLQTLFDFLKVKWLDSSQGGKGCYRKDSKAFNMVSARFLYDIYTEVTVHFATQFKQNYTVVGGSSSVDANYLQRNSFDYVIMWKRQETGCRRRSLTPEIQQYKNLWDSWTRDDFNRRFFPGIGYTPNMIDPDAPKDSFIIKVNSINANRIVSARVGVSSNTPFALRIVNGNASAFVVRTACPGDTLKGSMPRYYNTNGGQINLNDDQEFYEGSFTFTKILSVILVRPETENNHVTMAFSGVYRLADFIYKHPKGKEIWVKTKKRSHFSQTELSGDRYLQCSRSVDYETQPFDNMYLAQSILEKWVKNSNTYQSGRYPWSYRGEYGNFDYAISAGSLHSGYPYQGHFGQEAINGKDIKKNGAWGHCHEMGHNIDNARVMMKDCGEVTNNVLCWSNYVTSKIERPMYIPGTRFFNMNTLVSQWKSRVYWDSNLAKYAFYGYYGWKFGIGTQSNAWRLLVSSNENLDLTKEGRYAWAMSRATGVDLGPYQKFLGMPLGEKELNATSAEAKDCWLPYGDQWAELPEIKTILADFQKELGRNCTAKTTFHVSDIPLDKYFDKTDERLDVDKCENLHNPFLKL